MSLGHRRSLLTDLITLRSSMEEADTLCSRYAPGWTFPFRKLLRLQHIELNLPGGFCRIGIMAGGALRCLGTALHLKKKFGEGFKITMTVDAPSRRAVIGQLMLDLSPEAKPPDADTVICCPPHFGGCLNRN